MPARLRRPSRWAFLWWSVGCAAILCTGCARRTPEKLFLNIQQLVDSQQFLEAELLCREFLQQYSQSDLIPDILLRKAQCHLMLQEKDEAAKVMERFVRENPQHPQLARAYLDLSQLAMEKAPPDYPAALTYLATAEQRVNTPSEKVRIRLQMGSVYVYQEDYPKALEVFSQIAASTATPDLQQLAELYRARCFLRLKQPEEATAVYDGVIRASSSTELGVTARLELAGLQLGHGAATEAVRPLLEGAYQVARTALQAASGHPEFLAQALNHYVQTAGGLADMGQKDLALRLVSELEATYEPYPQVVSQLRQFATAVASGTGAVGMTSATSEGRTDAATSAAEAGVIAPASIGAVSP